MNMESFENHGDIIFGLLACTCSLFVMVIDYVAEDGILEKPVVLWTLVPLLWVFF